MGSTEVFNFNSVELKVSVMVFKAGVAAVDEDKTTAGKVSILEDRSKSADSSLGKKARWGEAAKSAMPT